MLCLGGQPEASVPLRPGSHLKPHRVPQNHALGHQPGEPVQKGPVLTDRAFGPFPTALASSTQLAQGPVSYIEVGAITMPAGKRIVYIAVY